MSQNKLDQSVILERYSLPFYDIKSEALKIMTGLKSKKAIINYFNDLGVSPCLVGRRMFYITEEIEEAIKRNTYTGYKPKGKFSKI